MFARLFALQSASFTEVNCSSQANIAAFFQVTVSLEYQVLAGYVRERERERRKLVTAFITVDFNHHYRARLFVSWEISQLNRKNPEQERFAGLEEFPINSKEEPES